MDKTLQALTGLSTVDEQLSRKEALMVEVARALEERRAALREAIPSAFLAAYDVLGRAGRRPVVVAARGGYCSGCYLRLPPQLDSTIRRRQSLCSCPHCRRLLYPSTRVSDSEGAPEPKRETGSRVARQDRKSKRARGVLGRRRNPSASRASKRS